MTYRVTKAMIERQVERLNDMLGNGQAQYTRQADGSLKANAGVAYLTGAYGKTRIEIMSEGGGARNLGDMDLGTKAETLNSLRMYIAGYEAAKSGELR